MAINHAKEKERINRIAPEPDHGMSRKRHMIRREKFRKSVRKLFQKLSHAFLLSCAAGGGAEDGWNLKFLLLRFSYPSSSLAMMSCLISVVPAPMVMSFASRKKRFTGYSRVYP